MSSAATADTMFDVASFTRTARGSLRDEFDLDAVEVPPATAAQLARMSVLEGATMAHLRNVLVTATHKDARVTAFLVTWAFEKFWIADALGALAHAATGRNPADAVTAGPGAGLPGGPVRCSLGGFLAGTSIVAVHTTAGLIDDLVLDAAYDVAAKDAPPGLADILAALRTTKARHTAFFGSESQRRLAADPRAQRLTARSIRSGTWPIGAPLLRHAERSAFTAEVFGGEAGIRRGHAVAERVGTLPGVPAGVASELEASLVKGA